jgi:deoxycytidine triphosphate deaminase
MLKPYQKPQSYKVLPYQSIIKKIDNGAIKADKQDVQACSVDIRTTKNITLRAGDDLQLVSHNIWYTDYLPRRIFLKSTSARCGMFLNFESNLMLIKSLCFDIHIPAGTAIAQAVFYDTDQMSDVRDEYEILDENFIHEGFGGEINFGGVNTSPKFFLREDETPILKPNRLYLGRSEDKIKIANDEVGFLRDTFDLERGTLAHTGAGIIDAGFEGKIVTEMITSHNLHITEPLSMVIDIVKLTEPTEKPYDGNYQGQDDFQSILPKFLRGA